MNRKTFYILIALLLSVLFVYRLLCSLLFKHINVQIYQLDSFKNEIAFVILIFEISDSGKTIRIAGFSLLSLTVIGYFFRIMHWPFGFILFFGSLCLIAITLIINAIGSKASRLERLVILIYPLSRALWMSRYFIHSELMWWITDVVVTGLIAIFLWVRFAGLRLKRS